MTNDDMERNERITKSTLEDMEHKYHTSLEQVAMLEAEIAARDDSQAQIQRLKDELRETSEELSVANIRIERLTTQFQSQGEQPHKASNAAISERKTSSSSIPSNTSSTSSDAKDRRLSKRTSRAFADVEEFPTDEGKDSSRRSSRSSLPPISSSRSLRKIHGMLDQMKLLESRVANFKSSLPLPATPVSSTPSSRHGSNGTHLNSADPISRATSPRQLPRVNSSYHLSPANEKPHRSRGQVAANSNGSHIPVLKHRTNHSTSSTDSEFEPTDSEDDFDYSTSIDHHMSMDVSMSRNPPSSSKHNNRRPSILQDYQAYSNAPSSPRKLSREESDFPNNHNLLDAPYDSHHFGADTEANGYSNNSTKISRRRSQRYQSRDLPGSSPMESEKENKYKTSGLVESDAQTRILYKHERANSSTNLSKYVSNGTPVSKNYVRNSVLSYDQRTTYGDKERSQSKQPNHSHIRGTSVSSKSSSHGPSYNTPKNRNSVDFHSLTSVAPGSQTVSRQTSNSSIGYGHDSHSYHRHTQSQNPLSNFGYSNDDTQSSQNGEGRSSRNGRGSSSLQHKSSRSLYRPSSRTTSNTTLTTSGTITNLSSVIAENGDETIINHRPSSSSLIDTKQTSPSRHRPSSSASNSKYRSQNGSSSHVDAYAGHFQHKSSSSNSTVASSSQYSPTNNVLKSPRSMQSVLQRGQGMLYPSSQHVNSSQDQLTRKI